MAINILCIGDVVGKPGRAVISEELPEMVRERELDFVVCNAENAAGGSGITPQIFEKLKRAGVDCVTLGDHVYRQRQILRTLEDSNQIVRPANLNKAAVGKRWTVLPSKSGKARVGVCAVLGQMYMGANNSPWLAVEEALSEMPMDATIKIIDFHAEASSEKIAMGWFLNGRVSLVFGTHTHVPTADYRVLDRGTGFISDVGMTGPYDSVLGRRKDRVVKALTTSMPQVFDVASDDVRLCGVQVCVDEKTGRALNIQRVEINRKHNGG